MLLSSASIHRILCDSTITPIDPTLPLTLVTGGATGAGGCIGEPQWWRDRARTVLHVGRGLGTVPPRLRRALEARDEHHAFPGCRVQVDRTHAHHVREREHGRDTSLADPVPLCLRHHHVVHDDGWVITPPGRHQPRNDRVLGAHPTRPTNPALTNPALTSTA